MAGKNSFSTYWDYIATGKLPEGGYQEELLKVEQETEGTLNMG